MWLFASCYSADNFIRGELSICRHGRSFSEAALSCAAVYELLFEKVSCLVSVLWMLRLQLAPQLGRLQTVRSLRFKIDDTPRPLLITLRCTAEAEHKMCLIIISCLFFGSFGNKDIFGEDSSSAWRLGGTPVKNFIF